MKSSFVADAWSLARAAGLVAAVALAAAAPARAAPAKGLACMEAYDLACARAELGDGEDGPSARLRAEIAFAEGRFGEAAALFEKAKAAFSSPEVAAERARLARATADVTAGMNLERRGDVEVRWAPGVDAVLVDEAVETLQAAHDRIGALLGGAPPAPIRLEIYPSGDAFTTASGLPASAVQTTGVVALSKWNRLLVTSPRALARGYAWRDTLAHEYIHLVVAWRTRNLAPVWLQEGIARSHESMWRSDAPAPLQPQAQSLLATALAEDTLVPLARMHPSMAYLDSADEAALAFAQVSTMVEHLRDRAGADAVSRALDRVRDGADALDAVTAVAGDPTTDQFMQSWRASLAKMSLIRRKLEAAPTVLGAASDEYGVDPVLSKRRDLTGHARLGDLLRLAQKHDAALIEYGRAMPEDEPPSPLIVARAAESLVALGRVDEAVMRLEASIADYPEVPATRKALAVLFLARGRARDALNHFRAAADINPFDPSVQTALADLHASFGARELAARHARYARVLALGGEDPTSGASR